MRFLLHAPGKNERASARADNPIRSDRIARRGASRWVVRFFLFFPRSDFIYDPRKQDESRRRASLPFPLHPPSRSVRDLYMGNFLGPTEESETHRGFPPLSEISRARDPSLRIGFALVPHS